MTKAADLRKQASLARKAAEKPTKGHGGTDQLLLEMADRLERQAEVMEERDPRSALA